MRFGSVCSGIEAASAAWSTLGWTAAWFSEIEPFPCAVLAEHYPGVPNFGDMRGLLPLLRTGAIEAPDVLCGGTPCQAFSVAGMRASLGDERGNLTLLFCELANAIDDARDTPTIIFWENVPGVLSTKDNAFGCFLAGLAGEDAPLQPPGRKWANAGAVLGPRRAVAWRTLDAQYFGLAQRRRRVFVVASARNDFDPLSVLFEFEGVRRDTAPRREARQDTATDAGRGVAFGGNNQSGPIDVATARNACSSSSSSGRLDFESETFVVFDTTQVTSAANRSNPQPGDPCHPIAAGAHAPLLAFHHNAQVDQMRFDPHVSASLTCSQQAAMARGTAVRRLTPVECERLQGFPDQHTAVTVRGKPAADGPRYKALGNSWPVPVVTWIGARIAAQLA